LQHKLRTPPGECKQACTTFGEDRVKELDPIGALSDLIAAERPRIVRLWSKRLSAEVYEIEIPGKDLRAPLDRLVSELGRLLRDRGEDALRLWPEVVRPHGAQRYEQLFESEDLVREFKALLEVLLHVYARFRGGLEPEVAELAAELVGEGLSAAMASFARVLKTEEVRFREAGVMESVLHQVDVGILLADPDGIVSFATPPVQRLLGVPMRTVIGARALVALEPILKQAGARHAHGPPFKPADMPFLRVLQERTSIRGETMVVQRPGGGEAILELSATPIWEEGGELAGVIQTFTDHTESAHKSRALLDAYEELRRLQGRLLQRTRTQALGQLATGAAHTLNNYLNVLRLRITLLRREFKAEHVDALDRTVGDIGQLVSRLQEFSVDRGDETLEDADVDVMVRDAVVPVRTEIDQHVPAISLEIAAGAPGAIRVDPAFFRELIVNLVLAALARLKTGGSIRVSTAQEGSGVIVRVGDSGARYSEAELAQLFDPLDRAATAPQRSLILAVARDQVQRWGGELTVENVKEGGAAFRIRLPLVVHSALPRTEDPIDTVPAAPRQLQKARSVLVVDDDVDNAAMMAEVLTDEGYVVTMAPSGSAALLLWDQQHFDAALVDGLMPDMSGWELARELRKRSPHVLLAMVTGMDVRGQNRDNLALVDAVFRKPVDVGALDDFLSQKPPEGETAPSVH